MKDLNLTVTRALPTADGTVTSSDIDLGAVLPADSVKDVELVVAMPLLSATNLPSADTLTVTVQTGATASPSTSAGLVRTITGTGSNIAAQDLVFRFPPDVLQYVNVKFVAAGGTGDMSAKSATVYLRF